MKYKAIACDFDGTLVGKGHHISPKVKEAIQEFIQLGGVFSLATGKGYGSVVLNALRELNLKSPQIVMGGGEIIDPQTGNVLHGEYLSFETMEKLVGRLMQKGLVPEVHEGGFVYLPVSEEAYEAKMDYKTYKPLGKINRDRIAKVRIIFSEHKLDQIIQLVDSQIKPHIHDIECMQSNTPYSFGYDFTSVRATKHLAILQLAHMLEVSPEEMVGIGDGYNDFSLLEACGYKVAMGNAPEDLKAIADYVAPSVENDGVAEAIYHVMEMKN
jgi:Cof subfamily protein (haloacid dehalogenase superfamily)